MNKIDQNRKRRQFWNQKFLYEINNEPERKIKFLSAGFLQNKQEETLKQNFFSSLEPIRMYVPRRKCYISE